MDSWVWIMFGFAAGLVVAAIVGLILRRDASLESQQLAANNEALLAKDAMKSAILQKKLDEAESALEKQRLSLEVSYQSKLKLVESRHREKLLQLEKQFAALDAAFAAQIAVDNGLEPEITVEDFGEDASAADYASADDEIVQVLAVKAAVAELELLASSHVADEDLYLALEEEIAHQVFPAVNVVNIESVESTESEEASEADEADEAALEMEAAGLPEAYELDAPQIKAPAQTGSNVEADDLMEEILLTVNSATESEELVFNWKDISSERASEDRIDAVTASAAASGSVDDAYERPSNSDQESNGARGVSIITETDDVFEDLAAEDESEGGPSEQQPLEAREVHTLAEANVEEEVTGTAAAAAIVSQTASDTAAARQGSVASSETGDEDIEQSLLDIPIEKEDDVGEESSVPDQPDKTADFVIGLANEPVENLAQAAAASRTARPMVENGKELERTEAASPDDEAEQGDGDIVKAPAAPELIESVSHEDSSVWRGEYFNSLNLEGEPALVREDAELAFDWGQAAPAPEIKADGFSVRWRKTADLPPGLYLFSVTCSDGAKLWVEGRLVISAWYDHPRMTFRREMQLPGGPVDMRLEYYDKDSLAIIRLSWRRIG